MSRFHTSALILAAFAVSANGLVAYNLLPASLYEDVNKWSSQSAVFRKAGRVVWRFSAQPFSFLWGVGGGGSIRWDVTVWQGKHAAVSLLRAGVNESDKDTTKPVCVGVCLCCTLVTVHAFVCVCVCKATHARADVRVIFITPPNADSTGLDLRLFFSAWTISAVTEQQRPLSTNVCQELGMSTPSSRNEEATPESALKGWYSSMIGSMCEWNSNTRLDPQVNSHAGLDGGSGDII